MGIAAQIDRLHAAGGQDERHPIVLESRVRLLRNLDEPFPLRLGEEERGLLRERLLDHVEDLPPAAGGLFLRMEDLSPPEREALVELGLLDAPLTGGRDLRGLMLCEDPRNSIVVGDRDHFCLQARREGWALDAAYGVVDCLDVALEEQVDFAFSEEFGYLTASPRRAGTGLDLRLLLHLPALGLRAELPRILRGLSALHVEPQLLGASEEPLGLLAVRNARSLGRSEQELLDQLAEVVLKLAEFEDRAREGLLSEARRLLEDRVWTAYGQLRYGRLCSHEEQDALLGTLRLGCLAGIVQDVDATEVQEMWLRLGDGHLQLGAERSLDESDRSALRADRLRRWLEAAAGDHGKEDQR